tara:strand:- start:5 stop:121 length:117 start_codon:yes stop_codon:yes gene_type:complete
VDLVQVIVDKMVEQVQPTVEEEGELDQLVILLILVEMV